MRTYDESLKIYWDNYSAWCFPVKEEERFWGNPLACQLYLEWEKNHKRHSASLPNAIPAILFIP
jgi:hypothetical protein